MSLMPNRHYAVEIHSSSGNYLAEAPMIDTTEHRVLHDILTGQYEGLVRVYELREVSADIADAVAGLAEAHAEDARDWRIGDDLRKFLERYGIDAPRPPPEPEYEHEDKLDQYFDGRLGQED